MKLKSERRFGSLFGTPIINPPQTAILGMHAIKDMPRAVGGQVLIRPIMYLALTYDHRLVRKRPPLFCVFSFSGLYFSSTV